MANPISYVPMDLHGDHSLKRPSDGSFEASLSKKPNLGDQTEQKTADAFQTTLPFLTPKPDFSKMGKAFGMKVPDAPEKINERLVKEAEATPFIQNARSVKQLMAKKLVEQPFAPFWLEVAPGTRVVIDKVSCLMNDNGTNASMNGLHADVYLCEVRGHGQWVIKFFKDPILEKRPHKALEYATYQLRLYVQSKKDKVLSKYVACHANFDAYVDELAMVDDYHAVRDFLKERVYHGFHFVRFIPHEMKELERFKDQLQEIYDVCEKKGICHDLQLGNLRVTNGGQLRIIDLFEYERNEDISLSCADEILELLGYVSPL